MVRFAGYAKKSEPKWPYFMIGLIVIVIVILVLFVFSLVTQWLEAEINKPVTTTVSTTTTSSSSSTNTTVAATTSTTRATEKPKRESEPVAVSEQGGLKVTQMVIASGVEASQPVDDLSKISAAETSRVYCYTSFENADGPRPVKHVWIGPGGKSVAAVELTARGGASATWSYINIAGQPAGQWRVRVEAEDGSVLATRVFVTF